MRRVPFVSLLALLLSGCYAQIPLESGAPAPAPGTRVVIELSDQGRVGMDRQVGAEVASVEGALVSRSDTSYVLAVSAIVGLRGSVSRWQGERVTVRPEFVRRLSERRFSMGRTVVAVGVASAGFLAFVVSRSLLGGGNDGGPGKEDPPPGGT